MKDDPQLVDKKDEYEGDVEDAAMTTKSGETVTGSP